MVDEATKVCVITGSGGGLGRAFVKEAACRGYQVVATSRHLGSLRELEQAYGGRVVPRTLDVTDRAAIHRLFQDVLVDYGRVDLLVNNAGQGLGGAVEEVTEEQARGLFEVNVFGSLWCIQAVLPIMRGQRRGQICQVTSLGGIRCQPNSGIYHASKWALEGLSESLAQEVTPLGIEVMIAEPGPFRTEFYGHNFRRADPMAEYDSVVGHRRQEMTAEGAHERSGDPRQAASVVFNALSSRERPLRLLVGAVAAERAPHTYRDRLSEWERWAGVFSDPPKAEVRPADPALDGTRKGGAEWVG